MTEPDEIVIPRFIASAVDELYRLANFAGMVRLGFTVGAQLSPLLAGLADELGLQAEPGLDTIRKEAEQFGPYAASEVEGGFAYVNSLLAVRLVTILESVVADAVTDALQNRAEVLSRRFVS